MFKSTGCFESGKYYQEGEKLPSAVKRPCEMCYCIKGFRKCVMKKCAPLIRGCIPKIIPKEGNCCPTSYDCSRSLKTTRQIRQNDEDEPEEEGESIDFFSLLFGSDDPPEATSPHEKQNLIEVTTLQPFKALPTTEKSFFDLIRAGLEIIDANADKIDSQINVIATSPKSESPNSTVEEEEASATRLETSTEKFIETTKHRMTTTTQSSYKPESSTIKLPEKFLTSSTESTTTSPKLTTTVGTVKTSSTTRDAVSSTRVTAAAGKK